MGELPDVLRFVFFGSFFGAWITKELPQNETWITIAAVAAAVMALLSLVALVNRRS